MRRWRTLGIGLARMVVVAVAAALLLLGGAFLVLETGWGRDQLRALIVAQANRYLVATLDIGALRGSLLRGIELERVTLSQNGDPVVSIDRVRLSYSIRELVDQGTTIRSLTLDRPHIVARKNADGQWNLAGLVRRDTQRPPAAGPRRPIVIQEIVIVDGTLTIGDPVSFGAARVPTSFTHLNTTVAFAYRPVTWSLDFSAASFTGAGPDLTVNSLTGGLSNGADGWQFDGLKVVTPRSEFTLDGRVDRSAAPTRLDLSVAAPRFAFQEWSGVLRGLTNIAVDAAFDARLRGPLATMATDITLRSTGGDVRASVVLDTTVPGWHGSGNATTARLDLAHWLNRPDRESDISGQVAFDLDLDLGGHFPRGTFRFEGAHAGYIGYEADEVVARGRLTSTDVRLTSVTASAYGANVRLTEESTLGLDAPFPFRFVGTARGVDLRQVPATVPVPHVESALVFDFDVTGRFSDPFIRGTAQFADSVFLGATLAAGASGAIDTGVVPFQYGGEGRIEQVDLNYFGQALDIAWLRDPRYAGTVRGRFRVDGRGSALDTMVLTGGGYLEEADLFNGRLLDAEVEVSVAGGSLSGTYDGELEGVNPAVPMADPRYDARLTGHGAGRMAVRDLLVRTPLLDDYTVDATLALHDSTIRGQEVTSGQVIATLAGGTLAFRDLVASGPLADLEASGTLELDAVRSSQLAYRVTRGDLAQLRARLGREIAGTLVTTGQLTGPLDRIRVAGDASLTRVAVAGLDLLTTSATYDITVPFDDPRRAVAQVATHSGFVTAFGRDLQTLDSRIAYDAGHVIAEGSAAAASGLTASLRGELDLDLTQHVARVTALTLTAAHTSWQLAAATAPRIAWQDTAVTVTGLDLVDAGTTRQHVTLSGTWNPDGGSRLTLTAAQVSLDALVAPPGTPARYGGLLDGTALLTGGQADPVVTADFSIVQGRVRRLPYQAFGGHVEFRAGILQLDVRLDQSPGVWLTATGTLPASTFDRSRPGGPMQLAVKSSPVSMTLLEGVTDVVRNVTGQMVLDVTVLGTSSDPHFAGRVDLSDAAFEVVSSGARYQRGRLALALSTDRVQIETLHVEDEDRHPLDLTGSLGTHELRVGDLQVHATARAFEVLRNDYGRVDVDADISLSGEFESPYVTGRVTVTGGSLNVDRILDRALFQPYATTESVLPSDIDPIVALNPWERLGLDLELRVPGTLRMVGDNVQVTPGTPLGLGNINLRAFGDLYLYKAPAQPMYVNGSFDSLTGTYAFQGRRFDLDPASSVVFQGDLYPELYITVTRLISGVDTRVSIIGPMGQPELRLASTPPLDPSDILSLIVFNTSTNELTALQQQQLAVRAGTLAAGFVAAPMVSALERSLGIDVLEIEPGADIRGGPRVTVGNEIAPGLVARFSRQFGTGDYDEATLEYFLSRILRIRATFSDAGALSARSPFRSVVERAGIDLLLYFSF